MKFTKISGNGNKLFRGFVALVCIGILSVFAAQAGILLKDQSRMTEADMAASIDVTLRLMDTAPDENIVLLVNGSERIPFTQETITVTIANGTLLEVDGTKYDRPFSVVIDSVTDEGVLLHNATEIKVSQSIEVVGRALIKIPK